MPAGDATAMSVFVKEGTVYTGGWCEDTAGVPTACFWTGTKRTDVSEYGSAAYSLFVDGSNVYLAGQYYSDPYAPSWIPCF